MHATLVFPEMPKMATRLERQVVQDLKLQLAHARHDGGRSLLSPIIAVGFRGPIAESDVPEDRRQPLDGVDHVPD
jgi:hypothetical protein